MVARDAKCEFLSEFQRISNGRDQQRGV